MWRKINKTINSIQITSDLHLEHRTHHISDISKFLIPSAQTLAILGDLGNPFNHNFKHFLSECSKAYDTIIYVSGNHEYYNTQPMDDIDDKIKTVVSEFSNVHYLNNNSIQFNNIRVLGTTLWSKIPSDIPNIHNISNDYNHINIKDEYGFVNKLNSHYVNHMHKQNVRFLESHLYKHAEDVPIIVITHHMPTYKCIVKKYQHYKHPYLFASHLDYMMKYDNSKIVYWLCGHTHSPVHIKIGQCQCITNPYGYKDVNNLYNKQCVIDIME